MSYISEIFDRLDLQHIREHLMHGGELLHLDKRPYQERLETAHKGAMDVLHQKFPDRVEREKITDKVYDYASTCEEVYMEIGMRCGAILTSQLLERGRETW